MRYVPGGTEDFDLCQYVFQECKGRMSITIVRMAVIPDFAFGSGSRTAVCTADPTKCVTCVGCSATESK